MNKSPDFIAELYYRTAEEGGRNTPAFSGYRPQVKFSFSEMQTSGQQKFLGTDRANPGDTVKAEIAILSPHFFLKQLFVGIKFEFREGSRIVGTGKILEILNRDLLAV